MLRDGRAAAVVLEGGETIEADAVAASCDPKRTFAMLPPGAVSHRLARRIAHYRMRGTTAQVLLALNAPPRFAAYPDLTVTHAVVAESLDAVERAFDPVKYRILPVRPVIEIHVPSVESPDLAPPGGAVVSCLVHFVPLDLEGGWSQDARDRLGDRVLTLLEEHIPGVRAACVGGLVMDPSEIEERYGVTGGHILHGEQALDQMLVRPAPECSGYATPVPGLWICGGGVHPGGGLTGGPGFLAAQAMLRGRI